jgi:hypothetical protein
MGIGHDRWRAQEHRFDLGACHTMLAALGPIAFVPIKAVDDRTEILHRCIYKPTALIE